MTEERSKRRKLLPFIFIVKWKEEAWKKNQGFNGIRTRDLRDTGALLYQLSYEATHWERDQACSLDQACSVKMASINSQKKTWPISSHLTLGQLQIVSNDFRRNKRTGWPGTSIAELS